MNAARRAKQSLIVLATLAACASASATTIIIDQHLQADANEGFSGPVATSVFNGTAIPTSQLLFSESGGSYSKIQIDYSGSGDQITLSHGLDQKRDGAYYDYSQAHNAQMTITVGSNTDYELSGSYSVTDVAGAGRVQLHSKLEDQATREILSESFQHSQNTLNQSFVLGGSEGDFFNNNTNSLTGTLLAGHTYEWGWHATTWAYPDADGGATATGNVTLKIGGGAPNVPDTGSTALLLGAGLIGLAAIRRKLS